MVLNTTVMTCVCERYSFITVIADSNVNFQVVRQFLFAFQVPKPKHSADFTSEFTQKSFDCSIQRWAVSPSLGKRPVPIRTFTAPLLHVLALLSYPYHAFPTSLSFSELWHTEKWLWFWLFSLWHRLLLDSPLDMLINKV